MVALAFGPIRAMVLYLLESRGRVPERSMWKIMKRKGEGREGEEGIMRGEEKEKKEEVE